MAQTPRKIALTGGIACGKSLAGDYLQQRGIPVIDADDVVHQLLRDDQVLKDKIRAEFGAEVFNEQGQVDRPRLGQRVFGADERTIARRKLLESWIHPATRSLIDAFYQHHADAALGVSIIPLLFESNLEDRYDEVWLLQTREETQLDRLVHHRGMSRDAALARIRNQMPALEKAERAQRHPCPYFIENDDSPEQLYRQLNIRLAELNH